MEGDISLIENRYIALFFTLFFFKYISHFLHSSFSNSAMFENFDEDLRVTPLRKEPTRKRQMRFITKTTL
jgi:hypothetical protein